MDSTGWSMACKKTNAHSVEERTVTMPRWHLNQMRVQTLQPAGAGSQHRGGELRRQEAFGAQRLLRPRQLVADLRTTDAS